MRDPEALRAQILSIEASRHPDYGGGFRDCVDALKGRTLHELLSHVREHARLPPPDAQAVAAEGEVSLGAHDEGAGYAAGT